MACPLAPPSQFFDDELLLLQSDDIDKTMDGVIFNSDIEDSTIVRLDTIGVFIAAMALSDDGVADLFDFEVFSSGRFFNGTILFGVPFLILSAADDSLFLGRFLLLFPFATTSLCRFSDVVDWDDDVFNSFRVFFVGKDRLSIRVVRFFVVVALDFTSSGCSADGTIPTEYAASTAAFTASISTGRRDDVDHALGRRTPATSDMAPIIGDATLQSAPSVNMNSRCKSSDVIDSPVSSSIAPANSMS